MRSGSGFRGARYRRGGVAAAVASGGVAVTESVPGEQVVRRWSTSRRAVAVVAGAALLVAVGVRDLGRPVQPVGWSGKHYTALGTELAPRASAGVSVAGHADGFTVDLDVHDLPVGGAESYYLAWLRGARGVVPIGRFGAVRSGVVLHLRSAADPAAYPEFGVSVQAEGDPPVPSARVILRAVLR